MEYLPSEIILIIGRLLICHPITPRKNAYALYAIARTCRRYYRVLKGLMVQVSIPFYIMLGDNHIDRYCVVAAIGSLQEFKNTISGATNYLTEIMVRIALKWNVDVIDYMINSRNIIIMQTLEEERTIELVRQGSTRDISLGLLIKVIHRIDVNNVLTKSSFDRERDLIFEYAFFNANIPLAKSALCLHHYDTDRITAIVRLGGIFYSNIVRSYNEMSLYSYLVGNEYCRNRSRYIAAIKWLETEFGIPLAHIFEDVAKVDDILCECRRCYQVES